MLLVTRKQISHLVFSPSPQLEDTAGGIYKAVSTQMQEENLHLKLKVKGLATNFARGRHSTGYRAFSPAGLLLQPANTDPQCSIPRPILNFPCYICRSPADFTGFLAGSGPARCLRHRPNLNFHRLGPEPLPVRGKHWPRPDRQRTD
jgi:hypothetical protein